MPADRQARTAMEYRYHEQGLRRPMKIGRTNNVLCFRMRNTVTLPYEEKYVKNFGNAGRILGVFYEIVSTSEVV
jgi:hypothetical protein